MSNLLARNGEPRHRRCEPQAPRSLLIGRVPDVVVDLADRVEPVVRLRDRSGSLPWPRARTNSAPAVPVILTH
jgi:hypothetical protein